MSKFAICIPDYEKMVIWCQFHNGSWAPPFPMTNTDKQKTLSPAKKKSVPVKRKI